MKKVAAFIVAGTLMASGSALAKDYGDSGTIEFGGDIGFTSSTSKTEDKDNNFKTDNSGTDITLEPSVYYYLLNGLPLFVGLNIGMATDKDNEAKTTDTTSSFGLDLGTGYLLPIGKARIGPVAELGFDQETTKIDDGTTETEATRSGPSVALGGMMKLPIGGGGVIGVTLYGRQRMQKEKVKDVDGEADVTTLTLGTSIGVSVWF